MRVLVLVLCVISGTLGYLINVPTAPATQRVAQMDLIWRQKIVTSLFENFCEDSTDDFIMRSAEEFMICTATDFVDPDVFGRLKTLADNGVLAKGIIFTEYKKEHLNEFEIVKDVLFFAKNFEVFFKAAAWARQNLNCGVFVDVFYSALISRKDTEKLSLPAPYEMLPNYFFRRDDIITGASLLNGIIPMAENVRDDGNAYVITSNYTSTITEDIFQESLAYFNEDIGLNTFIFLNKIYDTDRWNQNGYGEYLYHFMKQLVTRYNLERYSNSLPKLESINWDKPIFEKYDPMLIYSNGNDFNFRTKAMNPAAIEHLDFLKNIEVNIPTMVTRMMQNGFDKRGILNNLIDVLVTGENSYEKLAFMNLGKDVDSTNTCPSVLEHYMTLARDPIFWLINRRMVDIIDKAISIIPTYSKNELYFPGVELINVEMKALTTTFTMFETDVTEALKSPSSTGNFLVKISQPRLTHSPFSMKLNISSVAAQRGFAKIYLGPKMIPGQMAANKNEFMLLDSFEITLKKGGNMITRTSAEMKMYTDDFYSMKTLFKKIEDAEFGLNTLAFEEIMMRVGFPSRLMIPKGSIGGMPFQIFVFVAPLNKISMTKTTTTNEFNAPVLSPGYPLDLSIQDGQLFDLPNAFIKEIMITHKYSTKGNSNGKKGGDYKKSYNGQSQDYISEQWDQNQSGRPMLKLASSGKTNIKGGKSTTNKNFDANDKTKKYENKVKKPEKVTSEPKFTNTIDQWVDDGYAGPKITDRLIDTGSKDSYYQDPKLFDNAKYLGNQVYVTEKFVIDPVTYKNDVIKSPFKLSENVGDFAGIFKTMDGDNKNLVKTVEKGIKYADGITKNIDTMLNNKVKEIDVTKDKTSNKYGEMDKNIDDKVRKVIRYRDFDDDVNEDKIISVDSKTLDDGSVSRVFGFDPKLFNINTARQPYVLAKKIDSLKNEDKTIERTTSSTIKNLVRIIDNGIIKTTDSISKNIDKNVDSDFNNKVKEINITEEKKSKKFDEMDKNVDDTVRKIIRYRDFDDDIDDDKKITVNSMTVDDGTIKRVFGFDSINAFPSMYKETTVKRPYMVSKSFDSTMNIDKSFGSPFKSVVRTIDKGFTNSIFSEVGKNFDVSVNIKNNKAGNPDITKHKTEPMNDNVQKGINVNNYDYNKDKNIVVGTKISSDGSVERSFTFDIANRPLQKKSQTIYDNVTRNSDTDVETEERVYE